MALVFAFEESHDLQSRPPRMRAAIEKLAKKQSISMAAVIKQAIEKYLKERGMDWRGEKGRR